MPAAIFFTLGSSSVASTDVPFWCGIAEDASPGSYLGDSAFTDASAYLGPHSTKRGRQFDLDRVEAGTANIVFRSLTAQLDPANVDSVFYPNLKPLRRIRLFRHEDGVKYPMFDGVIERFNPEWQVGRSSGGTLPGYQDVVVQAVDAFEVLNNQRALDPVFASFTTALTGSNNDLVFTSRGPGGSDISIEYFDTGSDVALSVSLSGKAIRVVLRIAGGLRTTTAAQVKTALEADASIMALVSVAHKAGDDGSNFLNNTGGSSTAGTIAPTFLSGSGWPAETTGARIGRTLDTVSWPDEARALDAGLYEIREDEFTYEDNTSVLQHLQDCADSELGYVFVDANGILTFHDGDHRLSSTRSVTSQATFSDDGTGFPFVAIGISFDKDRIVNDVTVTGGLSTSIAQNVTDATSQAAFLRRATAKSTLLTTDADALEVANAILEAQKTPITRFDSITLLDTGLAGWNDAVLARDIGDRVTVRTNPPGHTTTVAYDCYIDGIVHDRSPGLPHRVTFQLTPISAAASGGGGGGGDAGALWDSSGDTFELDSATLGVLG